MRLFIEILALCVGTNLASAASTQIAVSPNGRYIVRFMQGERNLPMPMWDGDKFLGVKTEKRHIASLNLLDLKSGETIGLIDYDPQGGPLPTRSSGFKAIWSPANRYVAVSYPKNAKTENFFDRKGRVYVTVNRHSDAEVAVFRVKNGCREWVDLPNPVVFSTSRKDSVQGGEIVDRWEGALTLRTVDARKGKFYLYRLKGGFHLW